MSDEQRVPWEAVFGNARPVEIEIGPGRGETLFASAVTRPERNFFAIERTPGIVDALLRAAARRGLTNVRGVAGDARWIIARFVPDASVAAYHVYFPDPWPKRRHHRRRLVNLAFAAEIRRTLAPDGVVHLATDVPTLLETYAVDLTATGLHHEPDALPPPRPTTHFERRYAVDGTRYARFSRPA